MNIPNYLEKIKEVDYTPKQLDRFEDDIADLYENGKIKAPVHFSNGNAEPLCEIFQYVSPNDWVLCTWRNHFQALLHGIPEEEVRQQILDGKSMSVSYKDPNFYSSSIVCGTLPIALGLAYSFKKQNLPYRVWCFIGDMAWETAFCHETYKYAKNKNLPLQFVVEDNNLSTYTDTEYTWGGKSSIPDDVIYYQYKSKWPHYGIGKWINFEGDDSGHESQTF